MFLQMMDSRGHRTNSLSTRRTVVTVLSTASSSRVKRMLLPLSKVGHHSFRNNLWSEPVLFKEQLLRTMLDELVRKSDPHHGNCTSLIKEMLNHCASHSSLADPILHCHHERMGRKELCEPWGKGLHILEIDDARMDILPGKNLGRRFCNVNHLP